MKKNKISIKTIAQECNMGIGTISRYFNGGYVSEEKRKVIKTVVEKHNFQPNFAAHSIKKKMLEIYILIPDLTSSNILIVKSFLDEISIRFPEIVVFIIETTYVQERYLLHLHEVIRRNPFVLILFTISDDDQIRKIVDNVKIPTISYGRQWGKKIYLNEDIAMMYELMEKMAKNQEFDDSKSILYIGEKTTNIPTGQSRLKGFEEWTMGKNYQTEIYLFDKNEQAIIWELITKINFQNKIIICGTHTAYKTIVAYLLKNKVSDFTISDIRNTSSYLFVIVSNYYAITIDYEKLGKDMTEDIGKIYHNEWDGTLQIECLEYKVINQKVN